ncbi:MAG: mechanosensitive ion channel [Gemmatimonas sp.]|nr:mechanosensitive ion channel [Gemmatimonas sp.]
MRRVCHENPNVLREPPPQVLFSDFGDSSLDFSLLFWIADPLLHPRTTSELRFAIDAAFRDAAIEIPFPQRDLHVRSGFDASGRKERMGPPIAPPKPPPIPEWRSR